MVHVRLVDMEWKCSLTHPVGKACEFPPVLLMVRMRRVRVEFREDYCLQVRDERPGDEQSEQEIASYDEEPLVFEDVLSLHYKGCKTRSFINTPRENHVEPPNGSEHTNAYTIKTSGISPICPMSTRQDLINIVEESDKILSFR